MPGGTDTTVWANRGIMLPTEVRRPGLASGTFRYEKIYQTVSIATCILIMFIGYLLLSILKR